jgi:hypothetical protein
MPLSDSEKQRIREEEQFRMQVREEYRATHPPKGLPGAEWKTAIFWIVLVAAAVLLWSVMRAHA